jgi:hypothetical protein
MPETIKDTVLGDAQAGAVKASMATSAAIEFLKFFMTIPFSNKIQ